MFRSIWSKEAGPSSLVGSLLLACALGCAPEETQPASDPNRHLLGGATTVFDTSQNAFGYAARNAGAEHRDRFAVGNSFFKQNWVTAPASTAGRDGLGPLFNARSCSSCHLNDGRGRPPLDADEPIIGLLFRLSSATDTRAREPHYGGQFQPYSINGVPSEGVPRIARTELMGRFADGIAFTLERPSYTFESLGYGPLEPGTLVSPRVAPQMIGLGLLEAVPESTILTLADPDDDDQDGISGRPNWLTNTVTGTRSIGRFGWKANQPSLLEQTAGAFLGDMGITSSLHPTEDCTSEQKMCAGAPTGGVPEIAEAQLNDVVLYSRLLAVPAQRDFETLAVKEGAQVFLALGCENCHVQQLLTGEAMEFPELAHQTIHPYSDLLLHDMGEGLADNRPDAEATGSEWRTPPLWGIGLLSTVSQHTRLLHDGRARNVEGAILWHAGEALKSKEAFVAASVAERAALVAFLESL